MEKINKEELMKKLELSEEDMEKVAGGVNQQCLDTCIKMKLQILLEQSNKIPQEKRG